jgi:hypothetical protein
MVSAHDTRVVHEMGLVPLNPVNVPVRWMHVKLYPKMVPLMAGHERMHAYQVNKSALKDLPTNLQLVIDAFVARLNISLTVEGILSNWRWFFHEQWMDFGHLTILSFHALNGNRIYTTTTAADPQVLLPVINGAVANCCGWDVCFVRVQCILDFTPLTTINPYPISPILCVLYYIKLPQGSRAMVNDSNQPYTLVSFLGPDDLCLLTPDII